ncbi:MAG: Inner membrane protein YbhL [Chlamydiales bacterium]|nr:Inner membrane protein YbhL [Chlamydiales bacterium]MCH9620548.1 Inner membrane protein YbhL [Chlamydiales bacterium]MCH9623004.1 Inner membrane protein YbhL [Chlamydiales bacterium]
MGPKIGEFKMPLYDRDYVQVQDSRDVGVFSTRVYGWMAIGLAFTAAVAFFVYASGLYVKLMPFWWVWAFGTFGIAMTINRAVSRGSLQTVITLFLAYAGLEGVLFGTILPGFAAAFGGQVIWAAFATAASVFGMAMAYGMFTKSDLTTLGRILTFAVIGLVVVSLIFMVLSFFMEMRLLHLFISWLGLAIFVGLTAYDAQTIRRFSMQADVHSVASYKLSMIMALKMYVNVIMIFWYLLQIFSSGSRR